MLEWPQLQPNHQSNRWDVTKDYVLHWRGQTYRIPRFFSTDGASIRPKLAWILLYSPCQAKVMLPALGHDWMYTTHLLPRQEADAMFGWLCQECGVPAWKRVIMVVCLRLFGWAAWKTSKVDRLRLQLLVARLHLAGANSSDYGIDNEIAERLVT